MSEIFYLINSGREGGEDTQAGWRKDVLRKLTCGCRAVLPEKRRQTSLTIALSHPPTGRAVNCAAMSPIGIMRKELFELLKPYVEDCISFGTVTIDGAATDDYVSYINEPESCVVPRGGTGSMHRYCYDCKRLRYVGFGRRYFLTGQIDQSRPVFGTNSFAIILSPDLHEQAKDLMGRKLNSTIVRVIEHPKDGLPHDLDFTKPAPTG